MTITTKDLQQLFAGIAEDIAAERDHLCELDGAIANTSISPRIPVTSAHVGAGKNGTNGKTAVAAPVSSAVVLALDEDDDDE